MNIADSHQPPDSRRRLQVLERASWLGMVGNLLLAGIKISVGLLSGSLAVAGDGIDSLSDVVASMVTLYASRAGSIPPDREHPWGHSRLETIATKTLSLIIVIAGIQLAIMTAKRLLGNESTQIPTHIALYATGISIVGKAILAMYKFRAARIAESRMMRADALNMRNDILLSLVVLIEILFTRMLSLPVIDMIAGFSVSLWIIFTGIRVFIHTNTELMDGIEDTTVYREVFFAVEAVEGVSNPHRVRIRGLNSFYVIDLDVEVDGSIRVDEAHELACRLEGEIRRRVRKVFDIMVHVEPTGVAHHLEGYGLIPGDVSNINTYKKEK